MERALTLTSDAPRPESNVYGGHPVITVYEIRNGYNVVLKNSGTTDTYGFCSMQAVVNFLTARLVAEKLLEDNVSMSQPKEVKFV